MHIGFAAIFVGAAGFTGRDYSDASQPRTGARAQRAGHRLAQRVQGGVGHVLVRHRHHDDGYLVGLLCGDGAGLVVHPGGLEPTPKMRAKAGGRELAATRRDGDLVRVAQVKSQMRGGGVALGRLGFQAAQHHLLQPLGQFRTVLARRHRIDPQALTQATGSLRCAKGQASGAELVEHDAHGKDVAARIASYTHHLLGCDPGR